MAFLFCNIDTRYPVFSCCLWDRVEDAEEWERQMHRVLTRTETKRLGLSDHIRRGLLLTEPDPQRNEQLTINIDEFDLNNLIFQGLPSRPLYKILALRLCLLCLRRRNPKTNGLDTDQNFLNRRPMLPASAFGFEEESPSLSTTYIQSPGAPTGQEILHWIQRAGDRGILQTLGLRFTVGTDPTGFLPPSWSDLLTAAAVRNRPHAPLSVAARARAKHAHRGSQEQFFGLVRGSAAEQNAAAHEILLRLLREAAWINIHTFGGMEGTPSLELRVASGYGARWTADWSQDPAQPTKVEFRGFLEPQMANGHEKGWKH